MTIPIELTGNSESRVKDGPTVAWPPLAKAFMKHHVASTIVRRRGYPSAGCLAFFENTVLRALTAGHYPRAWPTLN